MARVASRFLDTNRNAGVAPPSRTSTRLCRCPTCRRRTLKPATTNRSRAQFPTVMMVTDTWRLTSRLTKTTVRMAARARPQPASGYVLPEARAVRRRRPSEFMRGTGTPRILQARPRLSVVRFVLGAQVCRLAAYCQYWTGGLPNDMRRCRPRKMR